MKPYLQLFLRQDLKKVGVHPMTELFHFYGQGGVIMFNSKKYLQIPNKDVPVIPIQLEITLQDDHAIGIQRLEQYGIELHIQGTEERVRRYAQEFLLVDPKFEVDLAPKIYQHRLENQRIRELEFYREQWFNELDLLKKEFLKNIKVLKQEIKEKALPQLMTMEFPEISQFLARDRPRGRLDKIAPVPVPQQPDYHRNRYIEVKPLHDESTWGQYHAISFTIAPALKSRKRSNPTTSTLEYVPEGSSDVYTYRSRSYSPGDITFEVYPDYGDPDLYLFRDYQLIEQAQRRGADILTYSASSSETGKWDLYVKGATHTRYTLIYYIGWRLTRDVG